MENFSNSVLVTENLPEIKKEFFTLLDKKYLKIIYIRLTIFTLILIGMFIAFLIISENNPPLSVLIIIGSTLVLLLGFSGIVSVLGFFEKRIFGSRKRCFLPKRIDYLQTNHCFLLTGFSMWK